jgi:hypothetical protein
MRWRPLAPLTSMLPAAFLTQLGLNRLPVDGSADRRGSWQLQRRLTYRSAIAGRTFAVPRGFVTDLASVPRVPVAFLFAGDCAHAAAVVHDWLYTVHPDGMTRADCDAVFREAAAVCGEPAWRCWLMWLGVRAGGAGPWDAAGQVQPIAVAADLGIFETPSAG